MERYFEYPTQFGPLIVGETKGHIALLTFKVFESFDAALLRGVPHEPSRLTNLCANEMMEFIAGKRNVFDVPFEVTGSDFERTVYEKACAIPYGETITFGSFAAEMGRPRGARSISIACSHCQLLGIIPVHRIVSATSPTKPTPRERLFAHLREIEQQAR